MVVHVLDDKNSWMYNKKVVCLFHLDLTQSASGNSTVCAVASDLNAGSSAFFGK